MDDHKTFLHELHENGQMGKGMTYLTDAPVIHYLDKA